MKKDMLYYEELSTEYQRNAKTFEISQTGKYAYVVVREDDEYNRAIFRTVRFTFDEAFHFACSRHIATKGRCDVVSGEYPYDFILVEPAEMYGFIEMNDTNYRGNTELDIITCTEDGEVERFRVFAIPKVSNEI